MSATVPAHPLGLDPLIAEAKARARTRRLIALGLIVAVAAAVGVALAMRPSPSKPAISQFEAAARDRVPIWNFGNAGAGVTWAINGLDVWVTADHGRTWRASRIPRALQFTGFFAGAQFVDQRHGWIFGTAGGGADTVFRTVDGGRSWQRFALPRTAGALAFVTATRGYFVSFGLRRDELFTTRDGGARWRPVSALGLIHGAGFDFVTARRGFAETSRALFATEDGGKTWARILGVAAPVADTTLLAPTVFGRTLIVPELVPVADPVDGPHRLYMHVSRDDGRTWSVRQAPKPIDGMGGRGPDAPSLSVVSPKTWVVASAGALFVTTDAGQSWRTVRPAGLPRGWGFHLATGFTSARAGWALFYRRRGSDVLMRTTDGGRHWTPDGPLKPERHKHG